MPCSSRERLLLLPSRMEGERIHGRPITAPLPEPEHLTAWIRRRSKVSFIAQRALSGVPRRFLVKNSGWGLTILRVVVGIVFVMHGGQKIFVIGIQHVAGMFAHLGIPEPLVSAVVVSLVEFLGGIALIVGLAT